MRNTGLLDIGSKWKARTRPSFARPDEDTFGYLELHAPPEIGPVRSLPKKLVMTRPAGVACLERLWAASSQEPGLTHPNLPGSVFPNGEWQQWWPAF